MDTLTQNLTNLSEMPRFDDGMVNIQELLKCIVESLINEIMNSQADELCDVYGTVRNGYRERSLITCVGQIILRIPKLRSGSYFP